MVFSSLVFLYAFLPLCLLVHAIPSSLRGKNTVLLVFSLFFYAWGEPIWLLQMLLSGALVFAFALGMSAPSNSQKQRKLWLAAAVVAALLPLFIFKYLGFFVSNLNTIFAFELPLPGFRMPIGISFYTFQIITYAVDLYRGECNLQRRLDDFFLYEALFPQLIAGPIVRYRDIDEQIRSRVISFHGIARGITRFCCGLAKKVLIANYAGTLVRQTLEGGRLAQLSSLELLLGIAAFSLQIYFDFSGYSDMAIGLGLMFGFQFKENFNYPYVARSVTDFWRRWHMSLSGFFRDYVYIPLGGNRRHQYLNLFLVWLLTGFWHGASWNFIFWGLYFLIFLVLEKAFLLRLLQRLPRFLTVLYMLPLIVLGWAIFKFTDLSELAIFCRNIVGLGDVPWASLEARLLLKQNIAFFGLALTASLPLLPYLRQRFPYLSSLRFQATATYFWLNLLQVLLILFLCTAALAGDSFNPFLYFRF